ncbi:MAG: adenine phosphoribosyltransferase [Candidatus Calescibacterium sp.]|nr:adenine phosphoribosyltransferase [Candidatus Calescibacterium sp.]MCX7758406.1 adenine phosphoribosyltransferase [bacterium]MDW8195900.1 adenine phosphoribosyltransferase [Candidatus Calescibacterium sp.]
MIETIDYVKNLIREIPNFPKPGINFKDITPLLRDKKAFQYVVDSIANYYVDKGVDIVVPIEARGYIVGSAVAYKLSAGVVPVRKQGKLPSEKLSAAYQLEYGEEILEIHTDLIKEGERVLIVDDLIATGGTAEATKKLVENLKGIVVGFAFIIELSFLGGREKIKGYDYFSLIKY